MSESTNHRPLANPAPLGLLGFSLTTWLLSMINAGWYAPGAIPMVLAMAFAFGGVAQFAAGLCELPRNNTFGFVAFCSYGAFWVSFALFVTFLQGPHGTSPAPFVAWYLALWGVFTLMMWTAARAINRAVSTIFLLLWITFFLLAAADFAAIATLRVLGGYFGLATAVAAFYLAAADILATVHGRDILPVGTAGGRLAPPRSTTTCRRGDWRELALQYPERCVLTHRHHRTRKPEPFDGPGLPPRAALVL